MSGNTSDEFGRFHRRNLDDARLFRGRRVLITGVGATGSRVAEFLGKAGLNLFLIDYDVVDEPNLARHIVTKEFIGESKAQSTARVLRGSLPREQIFKSLHTDLLASSIPELVSLITRLNMEVIVGSTGNNEVDRRLDRVARRLGIPFVVPGLYPPRRDALGEIQILPWGRDQRFACFACGHPDDAVERAIEAQPGAVEDVAVLAATTAQVVKALLRPRTGMGRLYRQRIASRRTLLFIERGSFRVIATEPLVRRRCPGCSDPLPATQTSARTTTSEVRTTSTQQTSPRRRTAASSSPTARQIRRPSLMRRVAGIFGLWVIVLALFATVGSFLSSAVLSLTDHEATAAVAHLSQTPSPTPSASSTPPNAEPLQPRCEPVVVQAGLADRSWVPVYETCLTASELDELTRQGLRWWRRDEVEVVTYP